MKYYAWAKDVFGTHIRVHTIKTIASDLRKQDLVVGKIGRFTRLSHPPYHTSRFDIITVIPQDTVITFLSDRGADPVKLLEFAIRIGDDSGFDRNLNVATRKDLVSAVSFGRVYMVQSLVNLYEPSIHLIRAAYANGFHRVAVILALHSKPTDTSIVSATHANMPYAVETFLNLGMDPRWNNDFAYLVAIERNCVDIFKVLYNHTPIDINITDLVCKNRLDIIKFLGPKITRNEFYLAVANGYLDLVKWMKPRLRYNGPRAQFFATTRKMNRIVRKTGCGC